VSEIVSDVGRRLAERRGVVADRLAEAAATRRFVNRRRRFEAGFSDRRRAGAERLVTRLAFVLLVALPNVASLTYFGWVAADQYAAEARFILRPNKAQAVMAGRLAGVEIARDTQVVAEFLTSRALVDRLEATAGLRRRYLAEPFRLRHLIDPVSPDRLAGLRPDDPVEDVARYWRRRADAEIAPRSGVVTFTVRAFSPEDARSLADAGLAEAEALVNAMNARIWGDAAVRAETLFAEAADRLAAAEGRLARVRDEAGIVAPGAAAAAAIGLTSAARAQLAALERDYAARAVELDPGSARLRALEREIAAARAQVAALEAELVGGGGDTSPSLARALERFAEAEVEREFAERSFLAAAAQLERTRQAAAAQSLYLDVFSPPALAEEALYARRLWWIGGVLAVSLAAWGAACGAFLLARNHMA
jgi:capsular polysaccharide transport system permease protein